MTDPMRTLARAIAGAPAAQTPHQASLSPRFTRGLVTAVNLDGTLSVIVDGSPTAINVDCLKSAYAGLGDVVELHTFGTRLVVDGKLATAPPVGVNPAGRIFTTGGQTINSTGYQPVTLGSTSYLQGGMTVGTNSLIVPVAGVYHVSAQLKMTLAVEFFTIALMKNGSQVSEGTLVVTPTNGQVWSSVLSDDVLLAAGDILTMDCYLSTASFSTVFTGTGEYNYLAAHLVSR
jgi:hypothetical protein